ncbi:MAG: anaerobic ribonucleoside-triphosphate reductase activating protein [Treponema sp.]|nr:anaerobic ribonucleoside-triphosphate reductase activating protein [Treponema sp.]
MNTDLVVLRKTSLVDYPGCVAAVIFFSGCNLRCPWCHNGDLVLGLPAKDSGALGIGEALAHLEKRRTVLGGAVLSGGEPTLRHDVLPDLVRRIKALGLKVKLDTNGTRPEVLEQLLAKSETTPDYIAMDLKLAPERYRELLPPDARGRNGPSIGGAVRRAARLLREAAARRDARGESAPFVEFRSLKLPAFTGRDRAALSELAGHLPWTTRPFAPGNCLDPAWNGILDDDERRR